QPPHGLPVPGAPPAPRNRLPARDPGRFRPWPLLWRLEPPPVHPSPAGDRRLRPLARVGTTAAGPDPRFGDRHRERPGLWRGNGDGGEVGRELPRTARSPGRRDRLAPPADRNSRIYFATAVPYLAFDPFPWPEGSKPRAPPGACPGAERSSPASRAGPRRSSRGTPGLLVRDRPGAYP